MDQTPVEAAQVAALGRRTRNRWALATLFVSLGLLGAKVLAVWLTDSRAVLSDAAESVVNVAAASVMLISVRLAHKPADEDHPFGHGKIEALAAGFEGALLLVAAFGILWEAIPVFFAPRQPAHLELGTMIVGATAAINGALGAKLVRVGRRHASRALIADGQHLLADAVSTLGVLGGLIVIGVTQIAWIDPLVACAMGLWVAVTGARVLFGAGNALLDVRRPDYLAAVTESLVRDSPGGLLDSHGLQIVDAGSQVFVVLRVRAPWYWNLRQSNALRSAVELAVGRALPVPTRLSLQIDPCTTRLCASCPEVDCPTRAAAFTGHALTWSTSSALPGF